MAEHGTQNNNNQSSKKSIYNHLQIKMERNCKENETSLLLFIGGARLPHITPAEGLLLLLCKSDPCRYCIVCLARNFTKGQ